MATFRNVGTIHKFHAQMVGGMVARGYAEDFAERCFKQIEGFGTYGFPESHAASFAHLVYVSAWLKCHHPAAFAAALLNSQPMGFYAPAQIVRDAREHGVAVRGADVNFSGWDCALEEGAALRLGFRVIEGFRRDWCDPLPAAAGPGRRMRFADFAALVAARLPRAAMIALAEADALRSLGLDRRAGLWLVRGLRDEADLPLLAGLPVVAKVAPLPVMALSEHVAADYQTTGLSLKSHPLRFLRAGLGADGIVTCAAAATARDGSKLRVAGVVLVRQRPGSAGGVVFATIEDETGVANIVVWPALIERFRRALVAASLLEVSGRVQRTREGIVHILAEGLADRSDLLAELETPPPLAGAPARADAAPADAASAPRLPKSRDFH
jgi:error-prone DNA polymerase